MYVEVANGGFGPNEGLLGVRGGTAQSNFADIAELYQEGRTRPAESRPAWC
ncbi:hypothetical protein [Streptomyces sp. TR1341]|uniref:hypothetical protein n=1 Tax=Streptomyces sp. TR1341 TaxID=2601266 RepID=UPI00138AEA41